MRLLLQGFFQGIGQVLALGGHFPQVVRGAEIRPFVFFRVFADIQEGFNQAVQLVLVRLDDKPLGI